MDDKQTSQQIKLQDGRMLGYAEYGPAEGIPVFYFHGFPSSRLDWQLINFDNSLAEINARVIAPDRPGYGLSEFKRGRQMVDWPDDVIELGIENLGSQRHVVTSAVEPIMIGGNSM